MKRNSGFTLVELLIVIILIGVLSAFFTNTSLNALKSSRDARRKADLELIRSGIETYHADCNRYPTPDKVVYGSRLVGDDSSTACSSSNTYITNIPSDPKSSSSQTYVYSTFNNGKTYQICAALESPPTGAASISCGSTGCGPLECNYVVVTP